MATGLAKKYMIHIFFVQGMFGSMIEYVLRAHTEYSNLAEAEILPDGSMHSFKKQFHSSWMISPDSIDQQVWITTPIYPEPDMDLPEILKKIEIRCSTWNHDKKILIHAPSREWAEINILFQYYKIAIGLDRDLNIFTKDNEKNIVNWNQSYRHWTDMERWEFREWFSLFYPDWIKKFIDSPQHVANDNFLIIGNNEIIEDIESTVLKIISFCELTPNNTLVDYLKRYREAQQYVIDEYKLINDIVKNSIEKNPFVWDELNIISEAIVQQKLRSNGYEIRCDKLNQFPNNSLALNNLLERH